MMKIRKSPTIDSWLDPGLFILRTGLGLCMLLSHGVPYLRSFKEAAQGFNDLLGKGVAMTLRLVIAVEVGASLLLVIGYKSRLAAVVLAITMAVASFHVHGAEFSRGAVEQARFSLPSWVHHAQHYRPRQVFV
jgi:putative oxidoreductase